MRHLNEGELIDLAEGTRGEHELPHLAVCEHCRAQLKDLRVVMSVAADVQVPEPSPLFWEHFSDRVRTAVAGDASVPAVTSWLSWRFVMPALALAAIILAVVVSLPTPSVPSSDPVVARQTT